jgi:glycosyltransferase involved in cell wall biosynthesis
MPFPENDQYWRDALDFLKAHHQPGDVVIAPVEFAEKMADAATYALTFASRSVIFPWAVIHKGLLGDIDERFLVATCRKAAPVFANEVFVIFSGKDPLPAIDAHSPHLLSLLERVTRLKSWTETAAPGNNPAGPPASLREALRAGSAEIGREMQGVLQRLERANTGLRLQVEAAARAQEALLAAHADSIRRLTGYVANFRNGIQPVAGESLKISVIMPVYNRAGMAGGAIESVMRQRYANRELIVVDDGSDDGLDQAVVPWLVTPGFVYLKVPRGGAPRARNEALKAATGDVVVYLDSDNLMYPDYLDAVAAVFAADPAIQCAHAAMLWDDGKNSVHLRRDTYTWQDYFERKIVLDMNAFAHRLALYKELGGFDETMLNHGDHDLVLRYTLSHPVAEIPAISAHYRSGDWTRISTLEASAPARCRIDAKYAKKITAPLRVLTACTHYPEISESYVDAEVRWMLAQGVDVEVYSGGKPFGPGDARARVREGGLAAAIADARPDIIHFHWLSMAARSREALQQFHIPVTIRSHGFDVTAQSVAECAAIPGMRSIYMYPHQAAQFAAAGGILKPLNVAFDSSRFYPRLGRDNRRVLRAGACLPSKDLDAFIRIAARCPEYQFILALARKPGKADLALLDDLVCLNKSLNARVDIRIDVPYGEMALLTAGAGVYLHTFGFKAPLGMPISIAESMACGAVPLVRDCDPGRSYAGNGAEYYTTQDDAVAILKKMLDWPPAEWSARSAMNADHAFRNYADTVVLRHILDDWQSIRQS